MCRIGDRPQQLLRLGLRRTVLPALLAPILRGRPRPMKDRVAAAIELQLFFEVRLLQESVEIVAVQLADNLGTWRKVMLHDIPCEVVGALIVTPGQQCLRLRQANLGKGLEVNSIHRALIPPSRYL